MKTYRVDKWYYDIEELECIKRTAHKVTLRKELFRLKDADPIRYTEVVENIDSHYCNHFETYEEARQHCINNLEHRIRKAEKQIAEDQERLEKLRAAGE